MLLYTDEILLRCALGGSTIGLLLSNDFRKNIRLFLNKEKTMFGGTRFRILGKSYEKLKYIVFEDIF